MCNTYLIETYRSDILYVDEISPIMPDLHESTKQNQIRLHSQDDLNNLRPDAVLFSYSRDVKIEILKNICEDKISEIGNIVYNPKYSNRPSCTKESDGYKIDYLWNNFDFHICGEFKFENHTITQIFTLSDSIENYLNIEMYLKFKEFHQREETVANIEKTKENHKQILKEQIGGDAMSFWKVNVDPNNLIVHLCAMYFLRHVFWVAFERGDVNFKTSYPDPKFHSAFYRRISQDNTTWIGKREESYSDIELSEYYIDFCNFLESLIKNKIPSLHSTKKDTIDIVDAKYEYTDNYDILNVKINNSEKLRKDITRQLDYKQLISEKAAKISDTNTNYAVSNIFWTPSFNNNDKRLEIKCDIKKFPIGMRDRNPSKINQL